MANIWRRQARKALAVLVGSLVQACLFETSPIQPGSAHSLVYTLQAEGTGKSECRVSISIHAWPGSEAIIFQSPKYYPDNPALPVGGFQALNLEVFDQQGHGLKAKDTLLPSLPLGGNFIVLPPETRRLTYLVDLDPVDSTRFGIPGPGTHPGTDLIDGSCFFLLPLVGESIATQWRNPVDIRLKFLPSPGRILVGTDTEVRFRSNYELMFVRAVYQPVRSETFLMPHHAVTVYTTGMDSIDLPAFNGLLEKCIRLVEDSVLELPYYHYFVGENPLFWGMEGSQGYWFKAPAQAMPEVHVHELLHTFVGIYNGDLEDPWYKEGMTTYLGNLLPLQAGLTDEADFLLDMLWARDTIPAVAHYALSAETVRNHLFAPLDTAYLDQADPENYIQLVYGKGAQAAMIMDRYILERSRGRYSVFNLVKDLNRLTGPAFHRNDLAGLIGRYTGTDAEAFLQELLDRTGPISQDSLDRTYAALKRLGRFAPGLPAQDTAQPLQAPVLKATRPDQVSKRLPDWKEKL